MFSYGKECAYSLLYFVGSIGPMPMNMVLDVRKVKLVKSFLNSREVRSLCARIRSTENSFLDICNKYDVHCEMSSDIECYITQHLIYIIC